MYDFKFEINWGEFMKRILLVLLLLLFPLGLLSQTQHVTDNLRLVALGKINEVRSRIPELLAQYPNDPGVKLLLGVVLEDAHKALDIYKEIVKDYPQSQWADNAYWRIIQFYAVLGDTTRAQNELDNFRVRYPTSPFLAPSSDVVRSSIIFARSNQKNVVESRNDYANNQITQPPQKATIDNTQTRLSNEDVVTRNLPVEPEEIVIDVYDDDISNDTIIAVEDEDTYYGLQVGIYQNQDAAEEEKKRFLNRRLRTEVVEKLIDGKNMYAVVIGHYTSVDSAEMAKIIVKQQCNCEPIIYQK